MAEILSASKYPVAFDDASSLYPLLQDRKLYRLASGAAVDALDFFVQLPVGVTLAGVQLPAFLIFGGGEVAYATSTAHSNTAFHVESLEERGLLGTRIQPHGYNERVVIGYLSVHHNQMKRVIQATQKYHGLVGLDANKPASPQPGMRYLATDTLKVYYCISAGTWVWLNYTDHNTLQGLTNDDHSAVYHNDARATTWHGTVAGTHIPDGNDHDHYSAGEGAAVVRIRSGVNASRPASGANGDVYFATDLDGGTLWVYMGGWTKVSGVPAGGIMAFDGPCPSGWTRYTALDGRYPRGAETGGSTGGSATHIHTYTANVQHYHTVDGAVVTSSSGGEHSHSVELGTGVGGTVDRVSRTQSSGDSFQSDPGGAHFHTGSVPQASTQSAGVASAETASASSLPASREVVWCQKS